jgi:hypothetical protein
MSPEQAVKFLECLRAPNIHIKGDGWVNASCPLARWTHRTRHDAAPSFGLLVKSSEPATYNCFACRKGTAAELLQAVEFYTQGKDASGYQFSVARQILADEELCLAVLPSYDDPSESMQHFEEWPLYWLESFKPVQFFAPAWDYLMGRQVSEDTIEKHRLCFDSHRSMIVCPYFTVLGKFAGARGRSILADTTGIRKHYDYSFKGMNNARLVWYNEQALDLDGPVVVVEGQFDCWRVEQVWPKVVANLTARPTLRKMVKLSDAGRVVQIPDNDETGALSEEVYQAMVKGLAIDLRTVHLPAGVKDPDECHPDFLRDVILDALK